MTRGASAREPAVDPIAEDPTIPVSLVVNGRVHRLDVLPYHTLVDVLRWRLTLTGTREGCGVGMCGACTILIDGVPVSGCLVLAPLADGREITTIEGLVAQGGELHPIQQAYVDATAFQCSYCTPGFIMATKGLLEEDPTPTVATIKRFLAGNLCRCGSYANIVEAVLDAATRVADDPDRQATETADVFSA